MTLTEPTMSSAAFPDAVLIADTAGGVAWIPASTPLTRLNYYDGRFLRADDLNIEQRAQRAYVELSNRAGGPGVVHGFDLRYDAGSLVLSPGLGIDPPGRVLLLPTQVRSTIAALIEAAAKPGDGPADATSHSTGFAPCEVATATPSVPTVAGVQLYLVALAHAEGLCGTAEVFGRLCDDACVTATDRPYRLDGVVLLLRPLSLLTPLPTSTAVPLGPQHLRSRVASAVFADERTAAGSRLSAAGLATKVWCLGAPALMGDVVPLAVLAWDGTSAAFLDAWMVRRERMEAPPRAYWAGCMELRPWPVFLAQVLQFQCQLADVLTGPAPGGGADPCADAAALLGESAKLLQGLAAGVTKLGWKPDEDGNGLSISMAQVDHFRAKVAGLLSGRDWLKAAAQGPARHLIDGGIVETPAAGYLPVNASAATSLRQQVQDLLGAGVDLRVCAVRRDQIPHELERAQDMDRISLLRGLDDPTAKEKVDVLVPDGLMVTMPAADPGRSFAVEGAIGFRSADPGDNRLLPGVTLQAFRAGAVADQRLFPMQGAGRFDVDSTGINLRIAAVGKAGDAVRSLLRLVGAPAGEGLSDLITRARRLRVTAPEVSDEEVARLGRAVAEGVLRHRAKAVGTSPQTRIISLGADAEAAGVVALWATAWVAQDPFTLPTGASTGFAFTIDFYAPGPRSSLVSRRFDGRAQVLSSVVSGALRLVTVRVSVALDGEVVNLRDVANPAGSAQADIVLTRGVADGQQVVGFRTTGTANVITGVATWSGNPMVVEAAVGRVQQGDPAAGSDAPVVVGRLPVPGERLVEVKAVDDPGVAKPANKYHGLAEQALTTLQGAKPNDPAFYDTASAQLFPRAAAGQSIEVRPVTDWVLFRRRRREDCEGVAVAPPSPDAVAAFVALAEGPEQAEELAKRLRDPGQSASDAEWKPFGTAEFDHGSAVLTTSGGVLRQGYRDAGGGGLIAFAGYAAAELSDPLGRPRARAVAASLAPEAELVDPADVDLVTNPPVQLPPGAQASLFVVSYAKPGAEDCVDVFLVPDVDTDEGLLLRRALLQGDLATYSECEHNLVPVSDVSWTADTVDPAQLNAVVSGYKTYLQKQQDAGTPRTSVSIVAWIAADWAQEHEEASMDHVGFLSSKLSVEVEKIGVVGFEHEQGCPVRLFVLLRRQPTDCVDLYVLPPGDVENTVIIALRDGASEKFFNAEHTLERLPDVSWTEGAVDQGQLKAMLEALRAYSQAHGLRAVRLHAWIAEDWAGAGHLNDTKHHLGELRLRLGDIPLEILKTVVFPHEDRCPVLAVIETIGVG